jgi:hypothetical protein
MKYQRFFHLLITIALLAVIALTVSEAAATAHILSQTESVSRSKCADLPSRHSIRTEYSSQRGAWITVSEDGPTGVDGGLIQLLSDYRTCSR